jgi:tetratricopeptide (TPR) repeat protein
MKKLFTAILMVTLVCEFTTPGHAQLKVSPSGGNKRASVYEQVGLTDINIIYNRPHVNKREGQIWGKLVPVGYVDQGFGTSKAAPWRAGANESTSIQFSTDVKIEGQPLAAGKYGFFIAYDPLGCTLIFSKNSSSWGSFYYNQTEDALRVKVKPVPADKSVEWLRYEFTNQTDNSATIQLEWEKLIIPFKVEIDLDQNVIAALRKQLRTETGFTWQPWDQAAQYCAQHKTNLEEGLLWADSATSVNFGGSHSFTAWSTKAAILDSLGRGSEAIAAMKKALPYGDMNELYFYGRGLTRAKKGKEAFDVFKMDYDKYPDQFFTNVGMARGYSALGDYKKALPYAVKARAQAPAGPNQATLDRIVKGLQEGKDIN